MIDKLRWRKRPWDIPLFVAIVLLITAGVLNLMSATASTRLHLVTLQLGWVFLGTIVFFVVALMSPKWLSSLAYPFYGVGLLLLSLVLITGRNVNQSQRWLHIGGVGGQPSEVMKLCLILVLAKFLSETVASSGQSRRNPVILFFSILVGLPVLLILRQPDLGTALILLFISISVLAIVQLRAKTILLLTAVALLSLPLMWRYGLKDYQRQRVYTFINPSSDPSGAAWQSRQSVYAIGSGGWTGKGYQKGTQNQLHFLPERWTDFPFAVWAEEWGFVGSTALLMIYLFVVLWGLRIAGLARDRFDAAIAIGVVAFYFWHAVFNVGMVIGIAPVVGVTLPLFSYGGSSMLTMMMAAGLLMNVSLRRASN